MRLWKNESLIFHIGRRESNDEKEWIGEDDGHDASANR